MALLLPLFLFLSVSHALVPASPKLLLRTTPVTTVLHSAICPPFYSQDVPNEESKQLKPRIVNGDKTPPSLRRYLVAIVRIVGPSLTSPHCSGTLITPTHVLTAAHCILPASSLLVLHAASDTEDKRNVIAVRRFTSHPNFTEKTREGISFDVAVIELEDEISGVEPLPVNVNEEAPLGATFIRSVGYGVTNGTIPTSIGVLHQVDIPVRERRVCDATGIADPVRNACAGYDRRVCMVCNGDSGGPALQYEDEERVIVGVASWITDRSCGSGLFIMIRIAAFEQWLDSVVKGEHRYRKWRIGQGSIGDEHEEPEEKPPGIGAFPPDNDAENEVGESENVLNDGGGGISAGLVGGIAAAVVAVASFIAGIRVFMIRRKKGETVVENEQRGIEQVHILPEQNHDAEERRHESVEESATEALQLEYTPIVHEGAQPALQQPHFVLPDAFRKF